MGLERNLLERRTGGHGEEMAQDEVREPGGRPGKKGLTQAWTVG